MLSLAENSDESSPSGARTNAIEPVVHGRDAHRREVDAGEERGELRAPRSLRVA